MSKAPPQAVIAFLDVLGFSATVREKALDAVWHRRVLTLFRSTVSAAAEFHTPGEIELAKAMQRAAPEVLIHSFSDSIVVSSVDPERGGWRVLGATAALCIELMKEDLFCRGGAVVGGLMHDPSSVVGEGLIRAVELEKESAIYPRVIVDDSLAKDLAKSLTHGNEVATLARDLDGCWYLDVLTTSAHRDSSYEELRRIAEALLRKLERAREADRLKFLASWRWLVLKLEDVVVRNSIPGIPIGDLRRLAVL